MLKNSTFMSKERYDIRNIQIHLEFKEATKDQVMVLGELVYNTFFENFNENFIIASTINNKDVNIFKKVKNHFDKVKYVEKKSFEFECYYSGFLKTEDCKIYRDIDKKLENSIFLEPEDSREEHKLCIDSYDFTTEESSKNSAFEILNLKNKKYTQNNGGADIMLQYQVLYMKKDYNLNQEEGYFGTIQWNIGGYTCGEDYNDIVKYLEEFFKKVVNTIDFVTGNICFTPENLILPFYEYFEKNNFTENKLKQLNKYDYIDKLYCKSLYKYEDIECLKSVEWLNYLPYKVFQKVDKNIMEDDLILIDTYKDKGTFIKIDKDIKQVSIDDKLKLRKYINAILIKGYQQMPHDSLRWFWEEVPIYFNEIIPIKEPYINEYEIIFVSDGDLKYLPK